MVLDLPQFTWKMVIKLEMVDYIRSRLCFIDVKDVHAENEF